MSDLPLTRFVQTALGAESKAEAHALLSERLNGKLHKRNRLAEEVLNGYVSEGFIPDLQRALGCERVDLQAAIADTVQVFRRESWERRFASLGPHIYLVTLRRPSPLFAAACVANRKVVPLEGVGADTDAETLTLLVQVHLADIPESIPVFGPVERLDVHLTPDNGYTFDLKGKLLGPLQESRHSGVSMYLS